MPRVPADVPAPEAPTSISTGEDNVGVHAGGLFPTPQAKAGPCPRKTVNVAEQPAESDNDRKLLVDSQLEILDLQIDAVGDETDSDGGNDGDYEEVELLIPVVSGRSTKCSRLACFNIIWIIIAADANFDQQCLREIILRFYNACGTEILGISTTFSDGR